MPAPSSTSVQSDLGGPTGHGEIAVPRGDDAVMQLDMSSVFPDGLNYFGALFNMRDMHLSTNGTLSFGAPLTAYPTADNAGIRLDVIAPFWGDVDTRLDGEDAESGAIWVDMAPSRGTVTITWDTVGVYRRDATVTNTFQLQLVDRQNGDFDIIFRYEHIGWAIGSSILDDGARAGLASARLPSPIWVDQDPATLSETIGNTGTVGLWVYQMRQGSLEDGPPSDPDPPEPEPDPPPTAGLLLIGTDRNDSFDGTDGNDTMHGADGNDRLRGGAGDDSLRGGDGADTIVGAEGDDFIFRGDSPADLSDQIFGGDGRDTIDGGYGNDILRGDAGDDVITGGFGSDTIIGGDGDDMLTGQALSDRIFGGDGDDFINGGFGFDRVTGGAGAYRFFHLGIANHGSDWIQD